MSAAGEEAFCSQGHRAERLLSAFAIGSTAKADAPAGGCCAGGACACSRA